MRRVQMILDFVLDQRIEADQVKHLVVGKKAYAGFIYFLRDQGGKRSPVRSGVTNGQPLMVLSMPVVFDATQTGHYLGLLMVNGHQLVIHQG